MPSTRALTSPDQVRALSIALKFSLEFFIRKNFRSLLLVGPRTHALLASKRNRLKPSEHVIGFREGLKRYVFAHSEEFLPHREHARFLVRSINCLAGFPFRSPTIAGALQFERLAKVGNETFAELDGIASGEMRPFGAIEAV
jgi:hypothetical protein